MATDATQKLYDQFTPGERAALMLRALARKDEAEVERLRKSCPRKTYTQLDDAFCRRMEVALEVAALACADLRVWAAQARALAWAVDEVRETCTLHHIVAELAFLEGTRCGEGLPPAEFFGREIRAAVAARQAEESPVTKSGAAQAEAAAEQDGVGGCEQEDDDDAPLPALRVVGERSYVDRVSAVEAVSQRSTDALIAVLEAGIRSVAQELIDGWEAFGRFCENRTGVTRDVMLGAFDLTMLDVVAAVEEHKVLVVRPDVAARYFDAMCGAWDRRVT